MYILVCVCVCVYVSIHACISLLNVEKYSVSTVAIEKLTVA